MDSSTTKKLRTQTIAAALILAFGILIVTFGVIVEDEPTAVGLLVTLTGLLWLFITRWRMRSLKMKEQNTSH